MTVSAVDPNADKASYSNYGRGYIDIAAPGGEGPPLFPLDGGPIVSTWPARADLFSSTTLCDPVTPPCPTPGTPAAAGVGYYRRGAGTSHASAHVAGVAALVVSKFGLDRAAFVGQMAPDRVSAILLESAIPLACPADARCQTAEDVNGFYGHGLVDAHAAVTDGP